MFCLRNSRLSVFLRWKIMCICTLIGKLIQVSMIGELVQSTFIGKLIQSPLLWSRISGNAQLPNHRSHMDNGDKAELRRELMPRHVAFILDGNRRWAKERGMTFVEGYQAGLRTVQEMFSLAIKLEIPIVSLYAFSSENWQRPQEEVDYLMQVLESTLIDNTSDFMRLDIRVSVIGDTDLFPAPLQDAIKEIEEVTLNNTKLHVIFALSYSGQNDITQACKSIAKKVEDGLIKAEDITKLMIEKELLTKVTNTPCPDLLIRTSGELRISNYYLWQSAYTEMYFTDANWPDFGEEEFTKALCSFQKRGRRFGKV